RCAGALILYYRGGAGRRSQNPWEGAAPAARRVPGMGGANMFASGLAGRYPRVARPYSDVAVPVASRPPGAGPSRAGGVGRGRPGLGDPQIGSTIGMVGGRDEHGDGVWCLGSGVAPGGASSRTRRTLRYYATLGRPRNYMQAHTLIVDKGK